MTVLDLNQKEKKICKKKIKINKSDKNKGFAGKQRKFLSSLKINRQWWNYQEGLMYCNVCKT